MRLLVGNILAFVPLGMLIPMIRRTFHSFGLIFLVGLLISAGIELGQLGMSLLMGFSYRFSDVDDVILNVSGVLLGYLVFRLILDAWRVVARALRAG